MCLPAQAEEKPLNWDLCQIRDALPPFGDAATPDPKTKDIPHNQQRTDIAGDRLAGTDVLPEYHGNVALQRGEQFMGSDSLTFDTETGDYVADGHVRYQDAGLRIEAKRAVGNQEANTHTIDDIRYQLVDQRGHGTADTIDMNGPEGRMIHSTFTTCDPNHRRWQLNAKNININTDEGFGVAKGAVVRLGSVPVIYAPWLKFPIDDRRVSGLLYPSIRNSGRDGFDYRQPIYLNLAPNYDATLYPRIMTNRGALLDAEFRYLYKKGHGTFFGSYMPHDDYRDKDNRGQIQFNGRHNLNRNWQVRTQLSWVSDERYMEDFSSRLIGVSGSNAQSTAGLYGVGRNWNAGIMADYWQLTDYTLTERSLPYARQPRLYLNWDRPINRWLQAGVFAEATRFTRQDIHVKDKEYNRTGEILDSPGGNRLDIKPYISMPLSGASWYVTPTAAWRYTAYDLDQDLADSLLPKNHPESMRGNTSPTRSMPIASLDAGLFFDRQTRFGKQNYLHTLEPRIFYLYAPYRKQDDLPLFDTRMFTFSWGQLFRDNRYSGADRQNDANQLTLALTSRLLRDSDGQEKLSASVGQILYFQDARVTAPGETPIEEGKSAWVVDANYAITDRWRLGAAYEWDSKDNHANLVSGRLRYLVGNDGIFNLTYRYRRHPTTPIKQIDLSFLYPISPSWSIVGRYYYSIEDKKPLETIAGVQWDSCCIAARALVRRYVRNREGEQNTAIQIEFIFKGLGSAGQDTERTLRRAILGYERDDLYLVTPGNISSTSPEDYDLDQIP